MHLLRNIARRLAFGLFTTLLFSLGLIWSTYHVLSNPHSPEMALSKSGIYNSFVSETLKEKLQNGGNTDASIPIDIPGVQKAIEDAFPPTLLQNDTEQVVNSVYAWASSKTTNLNYTIDLSGAKQQLANGIGQYVASRLSALPQCTTADLATIGSDPFTVTCVPPNLNTAAVSATVEQNVLTSSFLKNPVITANTPVGGSNKTVQKQFNNVRTVYGNLQTGMLLDAIAVIIIGTIAVYLSNTRRAGLYRLSIALISVGVLSIIIGWLGALTINELANKIGASTQINKILEQQIVHIVGSLVNSIRAWDSAFGVALIVIALGIAGGTSLYARKTAAPEKPALDETNDKDNINSD